MQQRACARNSERHAYGGPSEHHHARPVIALCGGVCVCGGCTMLVAHLGAHAAICAAQAAQAVGAHTTLPGTPSITPPHPHLRAAAQLQ